MSHRQVQVPFISRKADAGYPGATVRLLIEQFQVKRFPQKQASCLLRETPVRRSVITEEFWRGEGRGGCTLGSLVALREGRIGRGVPAFGREGESVHWHEKCTKIKHAPVSIIRKH